MKTQNGSEMEGVLQETGDCLIYTERHRWVGVAVFVVLGSSVVQLVRAPSWPLLVYWVIFAPFGWYLINGRRIVVDKQSRRIHFHVWRIGWEKRWSVAFDEVERIGVRPFFEIEGMVYETYIRLQGGRAHPVTLAGWWKQETHQRLCRALSAAVFDT